MLFEEKAVKHPPSPTFNKQETCRHSGAALSSSFQEQVMHKHTSHQGNRLAELRGETQEGVTEGQVHSRHFLSSCSQYCVVQQEARQEGVQVRGSV